MSGINRNKIFYSILFFCSMLFCTSAYSADECNFTFQCQSTYGDKVTDCANSWSDNSVCMCGNLPCKDLQSSPVPTPAPTPAPAPAPSGDQCDTTQQCKDTFGNGATDCKDSWSDKSICMCGNSPCGDTQPSPLPTPPNPEPPAPTPPNPTPAPNPNPTSDQCNSTAECKSTYASATDCLNSWSDKSVCMCGSSPCKPGENPPTNPPTNPPPNNSELLGRFDKSKDLFLAHFDHKPDADDIHSNAGVGTMLADSRFSNINYHAVAGTVGRQGGTFAYSSALYNLAFGNNWSNANANWNASLNTVTEKVINTLNNGGRIWVMEAGQSNFTADLVARVKSQLSSVNTQQRIYVVQHSKWNEDQTTPSDLSYVKNNTNYNKIPDGNSAGNGSPGLNTGSGNFWGRATSDSTSGAIWREARSFANSVNGTTGYNNPSISSGGMDFSDTVEACWIFGFNNLSGVSAYFNEFTSN